MTLCCHIRQLLRAGVKQQEEPGSSRWGRSRIDAGHPSASAKGTEQYGTHTNDTHITALSLNLPGCHIRELLRAGVEQPEVLSSGR